MFSPVMQTNRPPIDAIQYWRRRHEQFSASLRSVGCRSFRDGANRWFYRRVGEAYGDVLDKLELPVQARVLDAGAGIGMYVPLFLQRHLTVTASDISSVALAELHRKFPNVETSGGDITELPFPDRTFTLVHCFDVLYHVVDEEQWHQAIRQLCRVSKRYVVTHGPWLTRRAKTLAHLRQDSLTAYAEAFAAEGFTPRAITPTLFAFRFPWYFLRNVWPSAWAAIDRRLASRSKRQNRFPGAQVITVYERERAPTPR